ncbi:MAG: PD-(D/E)XK nuclease family protein, partial [Oscillospiraceae bacterium]|nr:PD-(D/E)XK nuclease family protein [Oscillospiraceae bacterium]
ELEFISKAEGEAVLPKKVEAFFTSNIGKRVLLADKVYRELDFFDTISPTDAFPDMQNISSNENIVIQGIADCVILEGEHLTIIDYKTDKVKTADELIARYSKQLELYKKSISKRLLKTDISCVIYSFELDKEISL